MCRGNTSFQEIKKKIIINGMGVYNLEINKGEME